MDAPVCGSQARRRNLWYLHLYLNCANLAHCELFMVHVSPAPAQWVSAGTRRRDRARQSWRRCSGSARRRRARGGRRRPRPTTCWATGCSAARRRASRCGGRSLYLLDSGFWAFLWNQSSQPNKSVAFVAWATYGFAPSASLGLRGRQTHEWAVGGALKSPSLPVDGVGPGTCVGHDISGLTLRDISRQTLRDISKQTLRGHTLMQGAPAHYTFTKHT